MPPVMDDGRETSPPPRYTETTPNTDSKANNSSNSHNHGPWLVRRTSIHIESTVANTETGDRSSISPSQTTDQSKGAFRGLFRKDDPREGIRALKEGLREPFDNGQLGTRVTIEATQPIRSQAERRIELKGLEQAASAKRWTGSGRPAEAWGKLMKVCILFPRLVGHHCADICRILSSGMGPVTHTCILDIHDQTLRFASILRC